MWLRLLREGDNQIWAYTGWLAGGKRYSITGSHSDPGLKQYTIEKTQ
jgi:hypothetical protein